MKKWFKELVIVFIDIFLMMLINHFVFGVKSDLLFYNAIITILIIDLVGRNANR